MSVTLLALISLQAYLIYRAYTQQSQQFDQSVGELLSSVKYKVERHHVERKINQEFYLNEIENALRRNIDSVWIKKSNIYLNSIPVVLDEYGDPITNTNNSAEMMLDRFNGNIEMYRSDPSRLKSIFTDLLFGYLSYEDRDLDTTLLSREIRKEMVLKKIDASYEWGIYNSFNKSFIFSNSFDNKALVYSKYQIPLFYRGMKNAVQLTVYFPSKTTFLFGNISLLLLSSVLIVLIILILFVVSLRIIFEQKKVGEMKNDLMNNITHELW